MVKRLKIISGGQTGVDRAALDVGLGLGLEIGGWCPAGRSAEDGPIPARYPLRETANLDHTIRTENNVRDSDATLVLYRGTLSSGTAYAVEMAKHVGRPVLIIDLEDTKDPGEVADWLVRHKIETLHIGGPRESSRPGIYNQARGYLEKVFSALNAGAR